MNRNPKIVTDKVAQMAELCRAQGMPFTVQRRVIMENLAGRTDHPTADQILEDVRERLPGVSRTTVYRVLDAFVVWGFVRKISNPEAKARFDADCGRHHHIHCLSCGKVADLHAAGLNSLPLPDGAPLGFQIIDYTVSFAGICTSCQRANNHKEGT